ncbi:hypothetical protein Y900_002945 [Mycolicibacterium aromaticivorans JS19b1 = JCM 16368]|uniref:Uncharacterized protein n=1 Tax=Mycolicibacterium aromaticivorans JS19b1 = JCM 16368 TaxID=1440774 RepID=A0A064CGM1_9MYCO|nr:hypothetical protein [Mycolicibacterium aromaticivorans]KDE97922.1 hypothetical protein Y900_002945 [Mycolicibacterium aromaticivorans JS19b1 = JCM 16368]
MRRWGRTLSAVALLAGAAAVPSCGGPGNVIEIANNLQSALMSMPGVTDAWVYHDRSYAEGIVFTVAVDVPDATRPQLVAVANRIAETRLSHVSNYIEDVEFWVTPDKPVTVRRQSHLDPAQIADDTERLRVIAAHTDGRIDWFRDDDDVNQLSVTDSRTPGSDLLDTVRRTAGDTGLTLTVSPASPSPRTPRMRVSFPLSVEDRNSVEQFLDTVPVDVFGVRIDDGGVRVLQAMVPADPAVAEQELSTVIRQRRAAAAGPMWLAWYVPSALGGVPMFGGVVDVYECSAAAAAIHQVSLRSGQDSYTLQDRLQSMIDTCAAPEQISTDVAVPPIQQPAFPSPPTLFVQNEVSDPVQIPAAVAIADRVASSGTTPGRSSPAGTVRPPWPARTGTAAPHPAAAVNPGAPQPDSGPAVTAGGSPRPATTPHRSTSRSAGPGR